MDRLSSRSLVPKFFVPLNAFEAAFKKTRPRRGKNRSRGRAACPHQKGKSGSGRLNHHRPPSVGTQPGARQYGSVMERVTLHALVRLQQPVFRHARSSRLLQSHDQLFDTHQCTFLQPWKRLSLGSPGSMSRQAGCILPADECRNIPSSRTFRRYRAVQ